MPPETLPASPSLFSVALDHFRAGCFAEADALCRRVLQVDPGFADAWTLLGKLCLRETRLDAAAECYRRAIALRPGTFALHNSLGNVLQMQGKPVEAAAAYRQALACAPAQAPERADLYAALGSALQGQRSLPQAVSAYREAIALRPTFAAAFYNMGTALQQLGELTAASESLLQAVTLRADYTLAWNNLGNVRRELDLFDEAEACYRQALKLESRNALGHYNLGCLLADLGDRPAAEAEYRQALALNPDDDQIRYALSFIQLAREDFAAGWRNYEFRWHSADHDTPRRDYPRPLWQGAAPASGRVLLWAEQGIGDEIFFAGLLPDAVATGTQLVLDCAPRLAPLLRRSFPGVEVTHGVREDELDAKGIAAHLPMGSLPGLFRNAVSDFARTKSPYLVCDAALREDFRARYADGRLVVGLAWFTRGKKTGKARSVELAALSPLFALPGIRWVSLQYGDFDRVEAEIDAVGGPVEVDRSVDQSKDLDRFASQIAAMDLVVTIDNATAHLAGALGVPAWVLLPLAADWRWFERREDCPWYPALRLLRQRTRGTWDPVLQDVRNALVNLCTSPRLERAVNSWVAEKPHFD